MFNFLHCSNSDTGSATRRVATTAPLSDILAAGAWENGFDIEKNLDIRVLSSDTFALCDAVLRDNRWTLAHTQGAAREDEPLPGTKESALALLPALGGVLQRGQLEGDRSPHLAANWEARAVEERLRWRQSGGQRRPSYGPNGAHATEEEALSVAIAASLGRPTELSAPPAPSSRLLPLGPAAGRVALLPPLLRRALQRLRAVEMPDVELEAEIAHADGATPLLIASGNGQLELVRELLSQGAAVDAALRDGATPLFIASEGGHLEVVRELLARGAAVDAAKKSGVTPLSIARQKGHLDVVRELLVRGAVADDVAIDPTALKKRKC